MEAAQSSAFYLAPNVRFTRTPDKVRLSQRVPVSEPVAGAVEEPRPATPSRVRYTRTPNHLFKQVWGGQSEAEPVAEEALPQAEAEHEPPLADFEQEAEVEECGKAEGFDSDAAAEAVIQPFAFISDHAFWELGPDSVAGTAEIAPHAYSGDDEPFGEDEEWRHAGADRMEQAALPPAMVMPAPAPFPSASSFGWPTSYSLNLRLSLNGWGEPTLCADVPTGIAPTPEPAAPVAQDVSAQGRGVLVRKRAVVEPAPLAEEPVAKPAPQSAPVKMKSRLTEIVPVSVPSDEFELPPITFLAEPQRQEGVEVSIETLQQNAGLLEGVLEDFNIRGEIVQACPGPVVTLYELEPAPGIKSSRVISLADDIARSMSAISARVAVV
ncbi:DNA translocase FtsK, partial [Bosea thiooxidans]